MNSVIESEDFIKSFIEVYWLRYWDSGVQLRKSCHYNNNEDGGARGVLVIVVGNGHVTRVQILDEIDCISHCTNTLGKGMNPIILPPAMGK